MLVQLVQLVLKIIIITVIGYNSGTNISGATGYTGSVALGYNSMITASNQIMIGTAA